MTAFLQGECQQRTMLYLAVVLVCAGCSQEGSEVHDVQHGPALSEW